MFQQPTKINHAWVTLYIRPNQLTHARMGLLVSKKAAKRAVARNRIKRLVRESFRAHLPQLKCVDIVVVARNKMQDADNKQIFLELTETWKKLIP